LLLQQKFEISAVAVGKLLDDQNKLRKARHLLFICRFNFYHHKHQGLGHLARSVSTVTDAHAIVFAVSELFSFLVDCSGMNLKGFGVVAFFAGVRASSFCIYLSFPVCIQSVVRGVWSRFSYGH
jgi:hypothetical protein